MNKQIKILETYLEELANNYHRAINVGEKINTDIIAYKFIALNYPEGFERNELQMFYRDCKYDVKRHFDDIYKMEWNYR